MAKNLNDELCKNLTPKTKSERLLILLSWIKATSNAIILQLYGQSFQKLLHTFLLSSSTILND